MPLLLIIGSSSQHQNASDETCQSSFLTWDLLELDGYLHIHFLYLG
jgi:hypothetical protein